MSAQLTMGPVLFNWEPQVWRDFYLRVADEAPVDTVYLGEVVCSKRRPLVEPHYAEVIERLVTAGKTVVHSTLAEVTTKRERTMTADLCDMPDALVEANDAAALYYLRDKPHAVGPFVNVYNEDTLALMARRGARHVTLPPEMPADALALLAQVAREQGVSLETQVYGRLPLAISARCYHARAHGRSRDDCRYVCDQDPDGMLLRTVGDQPFLAVNGFQTLSHACLNLAGEMKAMREMGINHFRLSPHSHDMVETATLFRAVLDGDMAPDELNARLNEFALDAPFCNGFYHRVAGHRWLAGARLDS